MKRKNSDIGTCPCPTCGTPSVVRRDGHKKFYVVCPNHRVIFMRSESGQEWVLNNAHFFAPGESAPAQVAVEPVETVPPVDQVAPAESVAPIEPVNTDAPKLSVPRAPVVSHRSIFDIPLFGLKFDD